MDANREIATIFDRMAGMLELSGDGGFRANAYARAARALRDHPGDVATLADDLAALQAIDGIGKATAEKIAEYVETGSIEAHDDLAAKVPAGLVELLDVQGLGPKTLRSLWETLGVESEDDLRRVLADGSILDVPRMGKKSADKIQAALDSASRHDDRTPLGRAMPVAEAIVDALERVDGAQRVAYAGSLRRGRETIGDIDVLVAATDPAAVRDAFAALDGVTEVIASGETKTSIRLERDGLRMQADLRIVPREVFGAALLYFTGSKDHNVRLRERAIKRGMTLNEYGLFVEEPDAPETPPQSRGVEPVAAAEEADVYAALDLPWIAPELREDRREIESAVPELIDVRDVVSELHAHTTASDGRLTIGELAEAAKRRGYHTIAVTDHSQSSAIAGGLKPHDLRRHVKAVRAANERIDGITILAGSEVDILADGTLDYDDELLAELDVVVASPHTALAQDGPTATKRLLAAIEHPLVHILGHPTGRLIGRRDGFRPDVAALAEAAAANDVALEINANWRRLDLRDVHVAVAIEAGALIAINCDVHDESFFDSLRYGVLTARRGGLTADRCVNTWPADELHDWLARTRG